MPRRKQLISVFVLLIMLTGTLTPAHALLDCSQSGPSYKARESGKEAFVFRMNDDLFKIVVLNDPKHINLYGACTEALSTIEKIGALLRPSLYTDFPSLSAIAQFIKEIAISAVCAETYRIAQEAYGEITDVLPMGAYVYDIRDIIQ